VISTFTRENTLASCLYTAFFGHHPVRISPDTIWITILQGLTIHVNQNAEALRDRFVDFEGKETITIVRPEITMAQIQQSIRSQSNGVIAWHETIDEFLQGVKERVKTEVHPLIDCDFSTSTALDRITRHVALLDMTQQYFDLVMLCGCGIPWIELTGTTEDWQRLRRHAETLNRYGLEWWTEYLLPVLDEFVDASRGKVNLSFWRAVVFLHGGSGMLTRDPVTGWVQCFFPYLQDCDNRLRRNRLIGSYREDERCTATPTDSDTDTMVYGVGVSLDAFPSSTNQAPFKVIDVQTQESMDLIYAAGLVATVYDETCHALEVKTGYAVLEKKEMEEK
jgi:hypothetical protein